MDPPLLPEPDGVQGKFARVHAVVRRIPSGRVTTYGRLARAVTADGYPLSARAAGWAMRQCPPGTPWHRVVNARGELSAEQRGLAPRGLQRMLLEGESVGFDARGQVHLERHVWEPGPAPANGRKEDIR